MQSPDTLTLIENRRSCRSFAAKPVEKTVVDTLKALTLRAPSGGNMIMYTVLEVTDPEKKAKLATICDNQPMIAKAPLVWIFLADMEKWKEYMLAASCPEKLGKPFRSPGIGDFHLAMQDAIIAAQTAAIAAEALGLGSCYIGDIIENYEETEALFGLPQHAAPACMLIMGYPDEKAYTSAKTLRPPIDSKAFMENRYLHTSLEDAQYEYGKQEAFRREHNSLPYENTGTLADYYYKRKYLSAFMDEMNRSAAIFIEKWCKKA